MNTAENVKRPGRIEQGVVVSNKMNKTIVVAVTRQVKHRQYKKFIRRTKNYMAHDENDECGIGDTVRIAEMRPISRHKSWQVCEVIAKAV